MEKVWKTKENGYIPINQMETTHIINSIRMLETKGFVSAKTYLVYLTQDTLAMSDSTLDAFEREQIEIAHFKPSAQLDWLKEELKQRTI